MSSLLNHQRITTAKLRKSSEPRALLCAVLVGFMYLTMWLLALFGGEPNRISDTVVVVSCSVFGGWQLGVWVAAWVINRFWEQLTTPGLSANECGSWQKTQFTSLHNRVLAAARRSVTPLCFTCGTVIIMTWTGCIWLGVTPTRMYWSGLIYGIAVPIFIAGVGLKPLLQRSLPNSEYGDGLSSPIRVASQAPRSVGQSSRPLRKTTTGMMVALINFLGNWSLGVWCAAKLGFLTESFADVQAVANHDAVVEFLWQSQLWVGGLLVVGIFGGISFLRMEIFVYRYFDH